MSGADRLKANLPPLYAGVTEMQVLTETEGSEFDLLGSRVVELLDQAYPESATWSLPRYEKDLQIVVIGNKPLDQRKSVIISKMRGAGKVSGAMLKNVAQAYDGGRINVSVDSPNYKIIITFIDTLGIPSNLEDLQAALEDIKPAHMSLVYEFRYLLIRDIQAMTINQLQQQPLSLFAGGAE